MRLVLLEFEQVIAETAGLRVAALEATCAALSLPAPASAVRARAPWATTDELAALVAADSAPSDEALPAVLALHLEREFRGHIARGVRLRDGIVPFLEQCALDGRVGVVTRAIRATVAPVLSVAGLEPMIRFLWCADDRARDGATAVVNAIGEHGRQARTVAVLADRADWLLAAATAGARAIAVPSAPPEVTPAASWDNFTGRVPSDLDAPR